MYVSGRLKISVPPLTFTSAVILPVVLPLSICSVPALTVAVPVNVLLPASDQSAAAELGQAAAAGDALSESKGVVGGSNVDAAGDSGPVDHVVTEVG